MTAQMMRDMLAHPPPPPFEMDLVDAGRTVGWISGSTIGFRGFANESEATHAAWVAHRTLARRIARTHGMRLVPIDVEPLALRPNETGGKDEILASNRPIAALVRPDNDTKVGDSFGFELTVPSRMSELELRGVAYLIYRTLRKSGLRWTMWRPAPRPAQAKSKIRIVNDEVPARHDSSQGAIASGYRPLEGLRNRLRLTTDAIRDFFRDRQLTVYK